MAVENPANDACRVTLDATCAQHNACLSTKPVYTRLDNLNTLLVKIGHALSSGRAFTSFLAASDSLFLGDGFEWLPVLEFPAEHAQWQSHALSVLEASLCVLDLEIDDVNFILEIDNSDWTLPVWRHYCKPRCVCGRTLQGATKAMHESRRRIIGSGPVVALLYRFKHGESANAWCMRNAWNHSGLTRAFEKCFLRRRGGKQKRRRRKLQLRGKNKRLRSKRPFVRIS